MNAFTSLHPTDQTLSSYGLGKLDDRLADAVNQHLEQCPDCRKRVAEMSADSFLERVRGAQVRPDSPASVGSSLAGLSIMAGEPGPSAPPPASTLPPGLAERTDYEVVRELGQGGMGTVYLALNRLMGRHEVLKVVSSHLVKRSGVLDRFLVEIRNAAKLHHPNVVTAYSAFRMGESIVFAMEYVEGLDLAKLVKAKGPLPVANACSYVHQAALGLQHAHEQGMVHRDIKPSNLMLSRQANRAAIKVLDFGLAKVKSEGAVDGGLTHEGQMLGTPDFIAPEQTVDARTADVRADIYSLGCTLYYLLTGGPPFQATSLYEILQAHHSMDAMHLNLARPEVPVELAALVGRMMAKEPERRFQTPKEVAQALLAFFKKGSAAVKESNLEVSQTTQPEAKQSTDGSGSVSPQPVTSRTPTHAPSGKKPMETVLPQAAWDSLIELKDIDRSQEPAPAVAEARHARLRWIWPALAVGLLLLGLAVAGAVVLRVKTLNGMIELVNLPKDAEVFVDGEEVAVTWPGGGKPAIVTVTAGKHKVKVKKGGLETSGEEVTIQSGGKETFTVRFAPLVVERQQKEKADASSQPTELASPRPTSRARYTNIGPQSPVVVASDPSSGSITNTLGMKLILIPAGEFMMGSPDSDRDAENDERPRHRVRITRSFHLGVHEVTQAQYEAVMGVNPSWFSANGGGKDQVAGQSTDRHPVEQVSRLDAVNFCNKLSEKDGLKPFYKIDGDIARVVDWNGPGFRLPTEAEWEYACRAGAERKYSFGDDVAGMGEHAWYKYNSDSRTHPVGEKRPNGFGLFDVHGNVWECCWDGYGDGYYQASLADDPLGPDGAAMRVRRGGGWNDVPRLCRSADRFWDSPGHRDNGLGFRVALGQSGHRENADEHLTSPLPSAVVEQAAPGVPASRTVVQSSAAKRPAFFPANVRWGVWRISGSEVVAKRTVSHGSHTGLWLTRDINIEDFIFEAAVKRIEGNGNLQISAGTADYNILYGLDAMNNYTRAYLSYWPRGAQASADPQWIGPVDQNKWDSLKIEKKGNIIVYYVNHKEVFRETNDRIKYGAFSLGTVNADARFRKIKITGAGGRVLLEGLPNLPTMEE
jgi:formylglycine-generating enzyme required for sulfatase activity/serine/threonine protein kinase